jgi:lipopolysaccharide transport system ATP-binding protein
MGSLRVKNLSKAFRRYPKKSGRLLEWLGMGRRHELKWILRDISFDVAPGEALGIIGINGAGKSTLLRLISGTSSPTAGEITVNGRIAALLELGMGFHPDFTGRQNVVLSAQLQGLDDASIAHHMAQIEQFAEIGDYIDQPVRAYSSGMQVRLAFSVATAVRPDILIVDEALAVGDTYFQHKSFDRIRRFREQGTTLLFVSHSPGTVKALCDRALLLDQGCLVQDGKPDMVLDFYNASIAARHADYEIRQLEEHRSTRSGSGEARIDRVELSVAGQPTRAVLSGAPALIRIAGHCLRDIDNLTVGIAIRDQFGNDIFGTNTFHHDASRDRLAGDRFVLDYLFPALQLGAGSYSITVALHSRDAHVTANFDWWDRALVFEVVPSGPVSIGTCNFPVEVIWRSEGVSHTALTSPQPAPSRA